MSACLLGVRCRYDGDSRISPQLTARLREARVIPVCPEQLGGLPTPRAPSEIRDGLGADVACGRAKIIDSTGADRTREFLRGADEVLRLARMLGATRAVLKSGSPSCDPAFGVTAAVLREAGLAVERAD